MARSLASVVKDAEDAWQEAFARAYFRLAECGTIVQKLLLHISREFFGPTRRTVRETHRIVDLSGRGHDKPAHHELGINHGRTR